LVGEIAGDPFDVVRLIAVREGGKFDPPCFTAR